MPGEMATKLSIRYITARRRGAMHRLDRPDSLKHPLSDELVLHLLDLLKREPLGVQYLPLLEAKHLRAGSGQEDAKFGRIGTDPGEDGELPLNTDLEPDFFLYLAPGTRFIRFPCLPWRLASSSICRARLLRPP